MRKPCINNEEEEAAAVATAHCLQPHTALMDTEARGAAAEDKQKPVQNSHAPNISHPLATHTHACIHACTYIDWLAGWQTNDNC